MTINEMIETLKDLAEEFGEDAEVRLAQQPNWPFEYSIGGIVGVDLSEDEEEEDDQKEKIVYIGEGRQLGYLSGCASSELGWK